MNQVSAALLVLSLISCQTAVPQNRSPAAQSAISDLAKTAGAPESEITIVSETSETWPDACLGCPGEGEMCAQVVTPGSRVVLLARGVTYEYHASDAGAVRRCR